MSRFRALLLPLAAGLALQPLPIRADEHEDLEEQVEVLAEEVRKLKEQLVIPETDAELAGWGGLGPAASKVYRKTSGLSLGGYGEVHYLSPTASTGAKRTGDFLRFVTYIGYKFTDRILMNTELEFEHATTSSNHAGQSGSVSVEFSYLDFLISDPVNVRAGNLLIPMGLINEIHEPTTYRGNLRPVTETEIIPTTWRELGVGVHGDLSERLSYRLYLVNGQNAESYGPTGIRGGRQKGNRVLFEDVAAVARIDLQATRAVSLGGSFYGGGAAQGRKFDGRDVDVATNLIEGHVQVRHRGFEGRLLYAASSIGDAGALSAHLSDPPDDVVVVPEAQRGWYLEGAYDVARHVERLEGKNLLVWARYEDVKLQDMVPAGSTPDASLNGSRVTLGVELKPHPNVVLKMDQTFEELDSGEKTDDPFTLGAGFIF